MGKAGALGCVPIRPALVRALSMVDGILSSPGACRENAASLLISPVSACRILSETGDLMGAALRVSLVLVAFVWPVADAVAQYKCIGPDGRASYQDRPCTHGEAQRTVKIVVPQMQPANRSAPNAAISGPVETAALLDVYRRWIDADRLAASTSRIALAAPVERLQALRREAVSMKVPACAERSLAALQALLSASAEGMLQFMRHDELRSMVYRQVDMPRLIGDFEWQVESANCPSLRPGQASTRQP